MILHRFQNLVMLVSIPSIVETFLLTVLYLKIQNYITWTLAI